MPKITYKITNMEKWLNAVANPARFTALLSQNMRRATELNGKVAERYMRKVIQASETAPNADLTILIKKSSKPLVDKSTLFQAITSKVVDDYTVFAGVARTDQQSYDIARVVHEGVIIRVTPKMRGMFMVLYKASMGEMDPSKLTGRAAELWSRMSVGWMPLHPDTTVIVIPPRPWATFVFHNPEFREKVTANWRAALAKTYRDCAKQ